MRAFRCACVCCACVSMSGVVLYAGRWFSCLPLVVRTLEAHRDNFVAPLRFRVVVAAFGRVPVAWERETSIEALMTTVFGASAVHAVQTFRDDVGTDFFKLDAEWEPLRRHRILTVATARTRRFLVSWYHQYRHLRIALDLAGDGFDTYVRARPDWHPSPRGALVGLRPLLQWVSRDQRARVVLFAPWCAARDGNFTPPTYDYFFVANHDGMLRATDTNLTRVPHFFDPLLRCRGMCPEEMLVQSLANAAIGLQFSSAYYPALVRWQTIGHTCAAARNYTVPSCPLPAPSMSLRGTASPPVAQPSTMSMRAQTHRKSRA